MPTDAAIPNASSGPARERRVAMPLVLLFATAVSTFWTGAVDWKPLVHLEALFHGVSVFTENLPQGAPLAALWQALAVAHMDWRQGLLWTVAGHNTQGIVFDNSRGKIKPNAADTGHDAYNGCQS